MNNQVSFNDAVVQAQQRAIAVRQKASFGNSSSGYEFGGRGIGVGC
ncbi:MAG: hypothetical protein ACRC80_06505 [Waterburya sp.]